jgi:hypothetical protein
VRSLLLEKKSLIGSHDPGLGLAAAMIPAVMMVVPGNVARAFRTISPRAWPHWDWASKRIAIVIAAATETIGVGIAEMIDASIADTGSTETENTEMIDSGTGDVTTIRTRIQMRTAITETPGEAEAREM